MAIKILQIDLQNDITPQIGSYDNAGGVTPNNWRDEDGVYSLGPTNGDGRTPYYWFTPTREVTDFDLCWEDYQDHSQTTEQYHLEIGDSAGNVVLSALRQYANYGIGPVKAGNLAYRTWHKILVEVRKASASSSTVTVYVDGRKVATGTSNTLLTSAKIALLGHVPNTFYVQNAGQRLRYVTIYDRSYASKGINLDGMMTIITGLISKLITKLSTVAFTGSYNDLSDKPTISTVNDATLTIQRNGTTIDTFTANASVDKTINIDTADDTKIPLAGSNQISGSLIPETTDAYDLGGYSYQWNNLYAKNYYYNGVAWGLDKANVWGAIQTISYAGSNVAIALKHQETDIAASPTRNIWHYINFYDKNSVVLGGFNYTKRTNGNSRVYLNLKTKNTNNDIVEKNVLFETNQEGTDWNLYPASNADINLGTSTNKWKSFNGINPGALSLPGDAYIDIDTTNYAWGNNFTFTPDYDGYCFLNIGSSSYSRIISLKTGRGEYYFSNQTDVFCFTFPVYKGKLVTILTNSSGTESVIPTIRVFPCQGNV